MPTPTFTDLLKLIEDRAAALRTAAGLAGPDARVPGCPDWSVRDLVAHLGEVQRFWAAVVAAGPAAAPPAEDQVHDLEPGDDLIGWSAASTDELVRVLTEAGPGRPCWTWWPDSGAPNNSGAVARHQVQEAAVHAFDAQEAAGRAEPLPGDVAADGVGEFLTVGMATMGGWPHEAGRIALAESGARDAAAQLDRQRVMRGRFGRRGPRAAGIIAVSWRAGRPSGRRWPSRARPCRRRAHCAAAQRSRPARPGAR